MVRHAGVDYWTTEELANSLRHRKFIRGSDNGHNLRRQVRDWAIQHSLQPRALTRRGAYLWREDEAWKAIIDAEQSRRVLVAQGSTVG